MVAAEMSGGPAESISVKVANDQRLGEMIEAFPPQPAVDIASPDRAVAAHLTEFGVSIRLFAA